MKPRLYDDRRERHKLRQQAESLNIDISHLNSRYDPGEHETYEALAKAVCQKKDEAFADNGSIAGRNLSRAKFEQNVPNSEAQKELASRELARRSLLHYIERTHPDYEAGWVHEDICRRLEQFVADVEARKSPRLMLFLPPRSGKSLIASTYFPAWVLGKHPEWEFIMSSYSADLPIGFSRKVRAQLQSQEYSVVFPTTEMSKDSTSAESWKTTKNGGLRAAGVGGGITGMGAHCFMIDDPVKDQEEADSETKRNATWEWYSSTAYTRLAPGGGMVCVQTRWHHDDLSGRLIDKMNNDLKSLRNQIHDAEQMLKEAETPEQLEEASVVLKTLKEEYESIDKWEIVEYQALATADEYLDRVTGRIIKDEDDEPRDPRRFQLLRKKDEALHPARFPRPLLLKYKATMQPRHWSALYQQNPVPDEGLFFTKDLFRYRPHLPRTEELLTFAAWDLAIGSKNSNDYTVGIAVGIDHDDNLWVLDMLRGRWSDLNKVANYVIDLHVRYNCTLTGIEKGQLELALKPILSSAMKKRNTYISLAEGESALKPVTDKVVRARPLQGRMQQGSVLFPTDQPWVDTLRAELLRFPAGVHDDCVDALAWSVRMTGGVAPPPKPSLVNNAEPFDGFKSWRDRLTLIMAGGRERNFMAR
jgi:predicted phage terminase large subunit-like protein